MAQLLNTLSGMPKMAAAFVGWQSKIIVSKVTQTIVDGLVEDTESSVTFRGTVQPLTTEELRLLPEGQRSWEWLMIHAIAGTLNLTTNDKIRYNGVLFKVMGVKDYSLNNYVEYHVVKDYQP